MTACLLFTFTSQGAYTASAYSEKLESLKQEEIERIFREINQISLRKAHSKYLESLDLYQYSEQIKENEKLLEERENELISSLANLNVRKIDPNNKNDVAILSELSKASIESDHINPLSSPIDTAPDLAALANAFTLYIYDGTRYYKGATHTYRYIRVIDNKGHGALVLNNEYDAVPKSIPGSIMASVLSYNFGYGFSSFLGSIPVFGFLIDWSLGNIFSVLDGITDASSVIASSSESLYRIFISSQTEMVYHYYYDQPTWKISGTSSTCDFLQTDFFAGSVNGILKHDSATQSWSSRSGGLFNNYVESFADAKYHRIDRLGSFTVRGFNRTFQFTPKFYDLPGYIG